MNDICIKLFNVAHFVIAKEKNRDVQQQETSWISFGISIQQSIYCAATKRYIPYYEANFRILLLLNEEKSSAEKYLRSGRLRGDIWIHILYISAYIFKNQWENKPKLIKMFTYIFRQWREVEGMGWSNQTSSNVP